MRNTRWIYKENSFSQNTNLNIDRDILNLLYNRDIRDEEIIYKFILTTKLRF